MMMIRNDNDNTDDKVLQLINRERAKNNNNKNMFKKDGNIHVLR